jgi:type I restriction enzyme S subunit
MNVHDGEFIDDGLAFIDSEQAMALKHVTLCGGDVLLNITGASVARVCKLPDRLTGGRVNQHVSIIRPDEKRLDSDFLTHLLRAPEAKARLLRVAGSGATREAITKAQIEEFRIPVPPLDEQRRIATILDKADALRRKRKRALELLDGLTQSIFLEMFGDQTTNPKKLPKIALGDLIKVKSGDGLVGRDMATSGIHPVYGGNGINGYHDAFMFEEPKVVIGRVGAYCGAVHVSKPCSWVTDNALYVSETKRDVSIVYLATALREANLNQYAGRAAQPLVSGSRIYPIEILLPTIEEQDRYEEATKRIAEMREKFSSAQNAVDSLFSSLQSRAFSGQL